MKEGVAALLYCKFDLERGPTVICSDPPNILRDHFALISKYFVPMKEFNSKVIGLLLEPWRVIGMPMLLEGGGYARNQLQFAICLVVCDSDPEEPPRRIAVLLSQVFVSLQLSECLLSDNSKQHQVGLLLRELRLQLNQGFASLRRRKLRTNEMEELPNIRHEPPLPCHLHVGNTSAVCCVLREDQNHLVTVEGHEVPLPLIDLCCLQSQSTPPIFCDFRLLQILPFMDGVLTVKAIAQESKVSLGNVIISIQHLKYYGFIMLIDIFSPSNSYRIVGDVFVTAFANPLVRKIAPSYVVGGHEELRKLKNLGVPVIPLNILWRLYSYVRETDQGQSSSLNIDNVRKTFAGIFAKYRLSLHHFVVFGLRFEFIARVHKYPLLVRANKHKTASQPCTDIETDPLVVEATGLRHMDAIKTDLNLKREDLEKRLESIEAHTLHWIEA